jgi:hypothetical protein
MNLTNPQRILKLAATLAREPKYLPDYCRHHFYRGKLPVDLGLPWWSFSAIEAARDFCGRATRVFEFGTGGSTIFLARLCQHVTSVEDDAGWHQRMCRELDRAVLGNVELRLRPFDFHHPVGFEHSAYLLTLDRAYDLIVVDGQDWTFDMRPQCFARAEQHIRPGGVIVVDDSWRYPQLRTTSRAHAVRTFEGVGPCRVGVTSTDLYFY